MPESPLDYDLDQLGMRAYWQDSLVANWNGSLPTSQTILIFLNLFIIAVGLGYGWKRYHWIGLTPLFIFVTYSLALGLAMDSGGRYIVPIDWIVYFYYSLAIVLIIRFIFGLFMANNRNLLVPNKKEHQNTSDRKPFWLTLVCLICLASLIPIANNLIPAVTKHPNEQTIINNALKEVPYYPDQGERLISGKILYPYLETKEKFDFSIITNQDVEDFSIDVNQKPANGLIDGRTVILINNVQAGINQVDSIYILNGDRPDLIWSRP
jgi:hypothetical protein